MGDAGLPPLEALPTPTLTSVSDGIFLLEPLSRRGHGPPLILLTSGNDTAESAIAITNYVPSHMIKWAEEGFAVVQIQKSALQSSQPIKQAIDALRQCRTCDFGKVGLVSYDNDMWKALSGEVASAPEVAGVVLYSDSDTEVQKCSVPSIQHLHGKAHSKLPRTKDLTAYEYPTSKSQSFASPLSPDFDYGLEAVSHTRNLTFFKRPDILAGPIFDLEEIWDEHTYYEFANRSVAHTMATMVQEPYVNHVPTITGGIGRKDLTEFYTHDFVFSNPADSELELISRTVGIDRIVDEFIFKCTHDRIIPWMLPAVPPTNVYLEIPMMAIVNIRGDRLYHEHISWDQATVMKQAGLLPDHLPWNLPTPDKSFLKHLPAGATRPLQFAVPAAGKQTAMKMREKSSVPSNEMFDYKMKQYIE